MSKTAEFSYRRHDAERLVEAFASLAGIPQSLVDLGGGIGLFADAFKKRGTRRAVVIDYEQQPQELLVGEGEFIDLDLARAMPQPVPSDLAICLEVAEHLPPQMADRVVGFLTASAPLVLFSAAIPGQRGNGHINCQPPAYWERKFDKRGYLGLDVIRPLILHDESISYWYRQNVLLFVRAGHPLERALRHRRGAIPRDFVLIHRKIASRYWADPGVRTLLKALPHAAWRAVRRRARWA